MQGRLVLLGMVLLPLHPAPCLQPIGFIGIESERHALPPQDGLEDDEDCLDDDGDGCANAYCDSYGDHNQR